MFDIRLLIAMVCFSGFNGQTTKPTHTVEPTEPGMPPCKDYLSRATCQFYRHHMACISHERRMKTLCPHMCGFCVLDPNSCYKTTFGCCRDGITPAKGRYFKNCTEQCVDAYGEKECQVIKNKGQCAIARHWGNCLKTCGGCRPCEDNRNNCGSFAKFGHCKRKDKTYKACNQCRKTCQKCGQADACYRFKCPTNRKCEVDNEGKPYCTCAAKKLCSNDDHLTGKVCARDNKEYKNLCYLKIAQCDGKSITVKNFGKCRSTVSRRKRNFLGCRNSKYGCCLDARNYAHGPNMEGCPKRRCQNRFRSRFCTRFTIDCGGSSKVNSYTMQRWCPKSCYYCN